MVDSIRLPDAAREAILDWYSTEGRVLPFRGTSDPYAVLVSEAMAQQTQAARAGEAWTRFIAAFPTVGSLAGASPADVLRAWEGLGYNRRALNLWRAARRVVERHDGEIPRDLLALQALPGVGPYTARAVAAIAFGMPVGAVDTNVRRVLGRMMAGEAAALARGSLQALADAAVPPDRAAEWTHALMDLGATVCGSRRPACVECPVRRWCRYAGGRAAPRLAAPRLAAGASDVHQRADRPPAARTASIPFVATSRWLRGRIIDRLRTTPGDGWTTIDGPIGDHDPPAVAAALDALARDGLVELDSATSAGNRRARLPVA